MFCRLLNRRYVTRRLLSAGLCVLACAANSAAAQNIGAAAPNGIGAPAQNADTAGQNLFLMVETSLPAQPYQDFALAKDAASFSPDTAENKDLVQKGFGKPVQVRRIHDGYVDVLATSAKLIVPVPMGWRGFDDGKRTRLFTPAGNIGIVINAMPIDGFESWDDTREQVWKMARQTAAARTKDARYQARLIRLKDGTFGMRESNIYEGEDDPYSSVILFRQHPDDKRIAVRVNLFAPVGDFDRYLALAGDFMRDMEAAIDINGLDRDFSRMPASP